MKDASPDPVRKAGWRVRRRLPPFEGERGEGSFSRKVPLECQKFAPLLSATQNGDEPYSSAKQRKGQTDCRDGDAVGSQTDSTHAIRGRKETIKKAGAVSQRATRGFCQHMPGKEDAAHF